MQIDIKTSSIQPLRQSFDNIQRRMGADKPVSRYLEAALDVQPTTNFHYRPLWDPRHELYDIERTAIRMEDWYKLLDPRQYYYGAYTIARARMQEGMEKNLELVEQRGLLEQLDAQGTEMLKTLLLPLRHYEWGANANNCSIAAYGYGTTITQAGMYAAMDRLGIAQYLSRLGLILDANTGTSLDEAKQAWLQKACWQGVRRLVEDTFVLEDWFELHVAQNLVLDGILYPLFYDRFEQELLGHGGHCLPMLLEFMRTWFNEHRRWADATISIAATESNDNRRCLADWAAAWRQRGCEAIEPLLPAMFANADDATAPLCAPLDERLRQLELMPV